MDIQQWSKNSSANALRTFSQNPCVEEFLENTFENWESMRIRFYSSHRGK